MKGKVCCLCMLPWVLLTRDDLQIEQSIKNRLDIYSLVDSLLIYDIRPKLAHWGRMAFLRACYTTWQSSTGARKSTFWEYADQELKGIRESLKTKVEQAT